RQGLGQRFVVSERIAEPIGSNRLTRLSERQMLLRKDVLRAEYDLGVVEAIRQPHQEFYAAGEGDRLQPGEAGKQLLPGGVLVPDQLSMKHRQRLRRSA